MPTALDSTHRLNQTSLNICSISSPSKINKPPSTVKIKSLKQNNFPLFRSSEKFVNEFIKISNEDGNLLEEYTNTSLLAFHANQIQLLRQAVLEHKQKTIGRYDLGCSIEAREFICGLEKHLAELKESPTTLQDVVLIGKGMRLFFTLDWIKEALEKFHDANSVRFNKKKINLPHLFNEKLKNDVSKRIGKWPNDLDLRLTFDQRANRSTLHAVRNYFLDYLHSTVDDWSEEKINNAILFLQQEERSKPERQKKAYIFSWDVTTPNIQNLLVKELSLIKQNIEPKFIESEKPPSLHYSTNTTGIRAPGELIIDWLSILKNPRQCMSGDDDLHLCLLDFIHDPTLPLIPKGWNKNGWQGFFNLIGQIHTPSEDKHLYSPADLVKLYANYGEGVRCLSSTIEDEYFATLPKENRINHLYSYLHAYTEERFRDNARGSVTLFLNACLSKTIQKNEADVDSFFQRFVKEKQPTSSQIEKTDLLQELTRLLIDKKLSIAHVKAFLDVTAFLHCNTQQDFDSSTSIAGAYIENGKVPTALLKVSYSKEEEWHLQTKSDLLESLKILVKEAEKHPKDDLEYINLLELLFPLELFKDKASSPLIGKLDLNIEKLSDFTGECLSSSSRHLRLVGVFLVLALNAMGQPHLPLQKFLEALPEVLNSLSDQRRKQVIDEVIALLPNTSLKTMLLKQSESKEFVFKTFIQNYTKALGKSLDTAEKSAGFNLFKRFFIEFENRVSVCELFLKNNIIETILLFSQLKLSPKENTELLSIILNLNLSDALQIQALNYLSKQLKSLVSFKNWEKTPKNLLQFFRLIDYLQQQNETEQAHAVLLMGIKNNFISPEYGRKYVDIYIEGDSPSKAYELLRILPVNKEYPIEELHRLLSLIKKTMHSGEAKANDQELIKEKILEIIDQKGKDSCIPADHESVLDWVFLLLNDSTDKACKLLSICRKQNWIRDNAQKQIWMNALQALIQQNKHNQAYGLWQQGHANKWSADLSENHNYISIVNFLMDHLVKSTNSTDEILALRSTIAAKTSHDEMLIECQVNPWKDNIDKNLYFAFTEFMKSTNLTLTVKVQVGGYLLSKLTEKDCFKEILELVTSLPSLEISEVLLEKIENSNLNSIEKQKCLIFFLDQVFLDNHKKSLWITKVCASLIEQKEIEKVKALILRAELTEKQKIDLKIQMITYHQDHHEFKEASQNLIDLCQQIKDPQPEITLVIENLLTKTMHDQTIGQKLFQSSDVLRHLSQEGYVKFGYLICATMKNKGAFYYDLLGSLILKIKEAPALLSETDLFENIACLISQDLNNSSKTNSNAYDTFRDTCAENIPCIIGNILKISVPNDVYEAALSLLDTCRIQKIPVTTSIKLFEWAEKNDRTDKYAELFLDHLRNLKKEDLLDPSLFFSYILKLHTVSHLKAMQSIQILSSIIEESVEWHNFIQAIYENVPDLTSKAQMLLTFTTLSGMQKQAIELSQELIQKNEFRYAIELLEKFGHDDSPEWHMIYNVIFKSEHFKFRDLVQNQSKKILNNFLNNTSSLPSYWLFALSSNPEFIERLLMHNSFQALIQERLSLLSNEEISCFFNLFHHIESYLKQQPNSSDVIMQRADIILELFKRDICKNLLYTYQNELLEIEAILIAPQLDKKDLKICTRAICKADEFFKNKSIPLSSIEKKDKITLRYIKLLESAFCNLPGNLNPFDFNFQNTLKVLARRIINENVSAECYLNAFLCLGIFDISSQISYLKAYSTHHSNNPERIAGIVSRHLLIFKSIFFYLFTSPLQSPNWSFGFELIERPEFQNPELIKMLVPEACKVLDRDLTKVMNHDMVVRQAGSKPLEAKINGEILQEYASVELIFSQSLTNSKLSEEDWEKLKSKYLVLIKTLVKKRIFLPNDLKCYLNTIFKRLDNHEQSLDKSLTLFCEAVSSIINDMDITPETTKFCHRENLTVLNEIIIDLLKKYPLHPKVRNVLKIYIQSLVKAWTEKLDNLAKETLKKCSQYKIMNHNDELFQELRVLTCCYSCDEIPVTNKTILQGCSRFLIALNNKIYLPSAKKILQSSLL